MGISSMEKLDDKVGPLIEPGNNAVEVAAAVGRLFLAG